MPPIRLWPSPAKLNLFLYITGRRADGYHLLQTLFQFLDYGDTLEIVTRPDRQLRLLTTFPGVPHDNNLIIRAARLLQYYCDRHDIPSLPRGADIRVTKRLPMGGGLGGGSSNAATTLIALNHLWQCQLDDRQLAELGVTLGADVPVFIFGKAAFAEGIGEQLTAIEPPEKWYLVVHPGVNIATPDIFADPQLKRGTPRYPLTTLLSQPYSNDCEPVVRKRFREVEQLLSWLLEYAPSRLTGTGACVFAEFDTETAARQVLKSVPAGLSAFVAQGVNLSPLQRTRAEQIE